MLKGSLVSMSVRVAGLAIAFLSHLLLARTMGAQQYGIYVIALGWAMVLVVPARLGLDNAALRFATIYREEESSGSLRGLIVFSSAAILLASAAVCLPLLAAKWIGLLGEARWAVLLWVAAMVFPLAALGWASALIRTAHRIFASQIYEQVLRPLLLIAGIAAVALLGQSLDASRAMIVTVLATSAAMVAVAWHAGRVFRGLASVSPDFGDRWQWLSVGWALLILAILLEALNQIDILLLGIFANATAAAHFAAASRLAGLVPFGLVAIVTVSGPLIASAYRRGALDEMARIARINARASLAFALAMAVVLAGAGGFALSAFGSGFEDAYPALVVLLAGGLINAFTGSVGYFLLMTGHQAAAMAIMAAALLVSAVLNILLIPILGVLGSAIASTCGVCVWNFAMLVFVRRKIGVDASAIGLPPRRESNAGRDV
jgi:O-antigen/teichoic acid export membrane protein